ncbi:secretion protein HlyD [Sulfurimonas gotlandica GD1]|uniref:Secretion protein HlyD n=1 Tax=Sulfurimonas gotlandica (strain DSM 19862 / JCM 16533 / GD1) TaxID=929558 RepID=B6BID7_SULGG|nr:efflux RND transporter periplasmic adaptor subunit [Sulfurimonas gotlandica]EDZ63422.1 secretion protein HlyD [Sulfurimonas gotlandica GD1]EHP30290.1 secretion protein HlyD [Sulfurimonas gotlandica GD1]
MKKLFTLLVVSLSLFGAQIIEISKKQQADLGVKTQEVTIVDSITVGPYNGIVALDKRDVISIGSTVEAVVTNIYVRKLDHVKKGEKLLTLKSNELLNLQEKYIKALIESKNIDKNYERNQKLQNEGIISHKKLLESFQEKQSIDLRVKLSANELLASGLSVEMLQRIQKNYQPIMQINILAPRDGIINKIDVNIGETVESNRSMMSIFADGKRFLELSVPVKSINNISIGDKCLFSSYSATITAIGNVVNSESQSVQVRAMIDSAKDIMINRIYSVEITKKISGAVKIKKSGLVFEENSSYVFKKVASGFEVVSVTIIKEGPSCYIVNSDLKAGDALAVSSTSALLGAMETPDE